MLVLFGASSLWCFRVWEVCAAILMHRAMEPRASWLTEGWLYPFFKLAYISDFKEILHKQQFVHSCNEYLLSTYWLPGTVPGTVTALLFSHSVVSDSLWPYGLWPARLLHPWDSPGMNTGMGCHFLLQGISPTQESNLPLLHCRQILYRLSYEGSPKT